MEYVGTIPNSQVLEILKDRKLQIDPSWSKKYSEYGAHFNRTTVEAMMMGAVPVATDLGMKNSEIFYGGENFIEVPHTATPKEFASIINDGMNNRYQWESIRANNISLLKMFEMKTVAQEYIDLIADANRWVTMKIGNPSVGLKNSCDKNLAFFNIPPHFNAHTGTQLSF